jgi:flagellar basal-body rod protein FlgF
MSGGIYLAAAGALVQQLRLEVLSNNIANIDTVGYKGDQSVFHIPDDAEPDVFEAPIEGIQTLSPYAPPFTCTIDFSQGAIRQTGNALDVAINGSGFFSIQAPTGVQYTRQGNFTLNREGVLVSQDGYPVMGEGGEITLEAGSVEIDLNGRLVQGGDEVGQLRITDFQDLTQLTKAGNGRFVAPDTAGRQERPEDTSVRQGCLEAANVIAIRAMTEMIETSRAFEAYQKIITTADEATADVIRDVGSVS